MIKKQNNFVLNYAQKIDKDGNRQAENFMVVSDSKEDKYAEIKPRYGSNDEWI